MHFSQILRISAIHLTRVGRQTSLRLNKWTSSPCRSDVLAPRLSILTRRLDFSSTTENVIVHSDSLLGVIDSEIQLAEGSNSNPVDDIPSDYPFTIDDNPGKQTITLRRKSNGEEVTVEVYMPDLVTGDDNEETGDDLSKDETTERPTQSNLPIFVSISKKSGTTLNFSCVAYTERITIQALSIDNQNDSSEEQYEGPDFIDLNDKLKRAFEKYLEFRGITPTITNHLHEYMINKDSREYLKWLKNLKQFVDA